MGDMKDYTDEANVKTVAVTLISRLLEHTPLTLSGEDLEKFASQVLDSMGSALEEYLELLEEDPDNPDNYTKESVYSVMTQLGIVAVATFDLLLIYMDKVRRTQDE